MADRSCSGGGHATATGSVRLSFACSSRVAGSFVAGQPRQCVSTIHDGHVCCCRRFCLATVAHRPTGVNAILAERAAVPVGGERGSASARPTVRSVVGSLPGRSGGWDHFGTDRPMERTLTSHIRASLQRR
ncbi:unnamed protein product [Protopolystoma xenopodis]|uniref:Uncharacterized protein n=1 Tax=Protopolystoma xenopodis TaxID=117903 RepID=A0A448WZA7_9PLAT|nr:unnamed protein product [Protopolystoma xenopodis]